MNKKNKATKAFNKTVDDFLTTLADLENLSTQKGNEVAKDRLQAGISEIDYQIGEARESLIEAKNQKREIREQRKMLSQIKQNLVQDSLNRSLFLLAILIGFSFNLFSSIMYDWLKGQDLILRILLYSLITITSVGIAIRIFIKDKKRDFKNTTIEIGIDESIKSNQELEQESSKAIMESEKLLNKLRDLRNEIWKAKEKIAFKSIISEMEKK